MELLIIILGLAVTIPVILLYDCIAWGTVAWYAWAWFVIPIFPNLPTLTWPEALGLMFFMSLFGRKRGTNIKDEFKDDFSKFAPWVAPWVALVIGFILHLFIY